MEELWGYLTDERKKLMTNTIEKLVYIENQIFDSWSEEERQMIIYLNRDYKEKLEALINDL